MRYPMWSMSMVHWFNLVSCWFIQCYPRTSPTLCWVGGIILSTFPSMPNLARSVSTKLARSGWHACWCWKCPGHLSWPLVGKQMLSFHAELANSSPIQSLSGGGRTEIVKCDGLLDGCPMTQLSGSICNFWGCYAALPYTPRLGLPITLRDVSLHLRIQFSHTTAAFFVRNSGAQLPFINRQWTFSLLSSFVELANPCTATNH